MRLDLRDVPPGSIHPVTGSVCVVHTADGLFAVGRRCPHQAADLANGYLHGGWLRCAWHNLPFDPRTGQSPCRSIPALRTYPLTEVSPGVYELDLG